MTKKDIVNIVYERSKDELGLTKKEVYEAVSDVLDIVENCLKNGEKVQISGFGTLKVKVRRGKVGRNPRTGEEYLIPERKVVVLRPSRKLIEMLEVKLRNSKIDK